MKVLFSVLLALQSASSGEEKLHQPRQLSLFCKFQSVENYQGDKLGEFEINILLPHDDIWQPAATVAHTHDPSGFLKGANFSRYDTKVMNGRQSAALVTANYPASGNLLVISSPKIADGVYGAAISKEPENQRYFGRYLVMSIPESWFYSEIKRSDAK